MCNTVFSSALTKNIFAALRPHKEIETQTDRGREGGRQRGGRERVGEGGSEREREREREREGGRER